MILNSIFHVTASMVYMTNSYLLLAWENSQHLAMLPLVSLPNHVWETSTEIPYWWHVITQIWVVLLIGCAAWEIWFNQSEALIYPDLGRDASLVWNYCAHFSDIIWRGNQWWHCQMSAVFSEKLILHFFHTTILFLIAPWDLYTQVFSICLICLY